LKISSRLLGLLDPGGSGAVVARSEEPEPQGLWDLWGITELGDSMEGRDLQDPQDPQGA